MHIWKGEVILSTVQRRMVRFVACTFPPQPPKHPAQLVPSSMSEFLIRRVWNSSAADRSETSVAEDSAGIEKMQQEKDARKTTSDDLCAAVYGARSPQGASGRSSRRRGGALLNAP
jgi:hypothetical protein